jgi:hypothetical protein
VVSAQICLRINDDFFPLHVLRQYHTMGSAAGFLFYTGIILCDVLL